MKIIFKISKNLIFISLVLLSSCFNNEKKITRIYQSLPEPYFVLQENNYFQSGFLSDSNPLKEKFSIRGDKIKLTTNSKILDNQAETFFECKLIEDTLEIQKLKIYHPLFEVPIDRLNNFAKTGRDTSVLEFKLTDSIALNELFAYYDIVHLKSTKKTDGGLK